jgi:hypothetical protein
MTFSVGAKGTFNTSINKSGTVAGSYIDENRINHGFLRTLGGELVRFDPAGSKATDLSGINASGAVAGSFFDGGAYHGFVRDAQGSFFVFDAPASTVTVPGGINDSLTVAGRYIDSGGATHGFVRAADGAITTVNVPGNCTELLAIHNAGETAGMSDANGCRWEGRSRCFLPRALPSPPRTPSTRTG